MWNVKTDSVNEKIIETTVDDIRYLITLQKPEWLEGKWSLAEVSAPDISEQNRKFQKVIDTPENLAANLNHTANVFRVIAGIVTSLDS